MLCDTPLSSSPDFNQTFVLQTDASERGGLVQYLAREIRKAWNITLLILVSSYCPEKNNVPLWKGMPSNQARHTSLQGVLIRKAIQNSD